MDPLFLILAGLAALCLPGWLGPAAAALPALAGRLGGLRLTWPVAAGLALLAGAPHVARLRPAPAAPPRHPAPRVVEGRWRTPPGRSSGLETPSGLLRLSLGAGVPAPLPGQPLRAWLRPAADGSAEAVAWQATGEVHGAWLDRWARAAGARTRQLVGRDDAGLLAALVLGQREDLAWSLRADSAASGTAHVLSISGMHVALLAGVLGAVAAAGSWRRSALLLAAFSALAGAAAPIARSYLGWLLAALALRCARPADGLRRLAGVALLLECWQPGLHRELSAQLSFLAVAGLVAAARLGPRWLSPLLAPLGAAAATAPLCAEHFGFVQPAGVLVTPLLTPPLAVILAVGLLAVLPGPLLAGLDVACAPLLQGALDLLRLVLELAARHGPPPLRPGPPPLPGVLLSLLVVLALVLLGRARSTRPDESFA